MIVRILGEGQLDLPDEALAALNELDAALTASCDSGDEDAFSSALHALLDQIRRLGTPVPDDRITPSEFVLPSADASMAEVSDLLGEEGLIPG